MSHTRRVPRTPTEEARSRNHKICGTCWEDKPLDEFHRSNLHVDGHKTQCKMCKSAYSKDAWITDNHNHRTRTKERQAERRAYLNEVKQRPCADCDKEYPPPVMHFHHRDPTIKIDSVAKMVGSARETLMAEIAKCDVLCSNCHIIRHMGI